MPQIAVKEERRVLNVRKRRFEGQGRVLGQAAAPPPYLVAEVAGAGEDHRNTMLVAGLDARGTWATLADLLG